jgi:hypothetical protein
LSLPALAEVAPERWTKLVFTPQPTALLATPSTSGPPCATRALRRRAVCRSRRPFSFGART